MEIFLGILLLAAGAACAYFVYQWRREQSRTDEVRLAGEEELAKAEKLRSELEARLRRAQSELGRLAKWETVDNAVEKARELLATAEAKVRTAESDAAQIVARATEQANKLIATADESASAQAREAKAESKRLMDEAKALLASAASDSAAIIREANQTAEEIAGKAYDVVRNADLYERTARAMKNVIEGYGDEYLKPAASLLDDLADDFAHKEAGRQLALAREHTKSLIKAGKAAMCDYVESSRREGAENFVLDAFNGKTDSILSRAKHDNYGKLEAEIRDAFTLVNYGGRAFRDARITDEYLLARLAELKWATVALELKRQEQEEQREFREWIREEQKAQREFEKAMREAAKEEEILRRAMAQAQAKLEAATEAQRAQFESQLAELNEKLKEAEERNQRALSMAQQTRRGHVYIISNIGSFGEHVYKVGLTRRLEPLDRIRELGDASVPFELTSTR